MNLFTRGFHIADAMLWSRRWWLTMVPVLLVVGLFWFLPDSSNSTITGQNELQGRLLLASFLGLMTGLLILSFICLSHAIANRQTRWVAGLLLFFPLTAVPYLFAHRQR